MFSSMAVFPQSVPDTLPIPLRAPQSAEILAECGAYRVRLAVDEGDLICLYRLRFLVFNLELSEGLDASYLDGLDRDEFDDVCDHLMVEHRESGRIVGTYRLQTGRMARRNLGYYSAQEFKFAPYERMREQVVECGRACIHRDFRSFEVLNLLWRGIALYAVARGGRYLIGCSSVTSQDTRLGAAMYDRLKDYLVRPGLRTVPTTEYSFELDEQADGDARPPKLLRAYLTVGAKICGPPALDRQFKTVDFLTLLDLENMAPSARARYLR
jgi:putative hemolysin